MRKEAATKGEKIMTTQILDYVIVGAGLTGLNLARELKKTLPDVQIQLLEKSKGCGGRMATRRINDIRFDHGAQFIRSTEVSKELIELWKTENVAKTFPSDTLNGICAGAGITQLAKVLARNMNISYDLKVLKLEPQAGNWIVMSDAGSVVSAKNVVLTAPLPQSLEILQRSGLEFDSRLSKIRYEKAVVFLIEAESKLLPHFNYMENIDDDIRSLCAQHAKGNSEVPSWSIVMTENWSHSHFDMTDDELLEKAQSVLPQKITSLDIKHIHVKKWRFSQPQTTWHDPYVNPHAGLYLAGDAFGGPSLIGALKSSQQLANQLRTEVTLKNR